MNNFSIVVATDSENGIGKDGKLPWHLPLDLNFFKEKTRSTTDPNLKNVVIMGRKTWDSIPEKFRPLPDRINVVMTRREKMYLPEGVFMASGFEEALGLLKKEKLRGKTEQVFVIGGGQIFNHSLVHPGCRKLYITEILESFGCDTFLTPFKDRFKRTFRSQLYREKGSTFYFSQYEPISGKQ